MLLSLHNVDGISPVWVYTVITVLPCYCVMSSNKPHWAIMMEIIAKMFSKYDDFL